LHITNLENEDDLKNLKFDPENTLLDIDLDYFSSGSPEYFELIGNIPHEEIFELGKLFNISNYCFENKNFDFFKNLLGTSTFQSRNQQSLVYGNAVNIFTNFLFPLIEIENFKSNEKKLKHIERVKKILKSFWCKEKEIFDEMLKKFQKLYKMDEDIADKIFGIFYSPIQFSTKETMVEYKNKIVQFLKEKGLNGNPLVTTVAKSVEDGFTPKSQEKFIETLVKEILFELFF
jgi:hypothetical protein